MWNSLLKAMLVPRVAAAQASVIRMRTWLRTEEKYNDDHSCSCSCFYCYCHCSDLQLLLAVLLLFLIRAAILYSHHVVTAFCFLCFCSLRFAAPCRPWRSPQNPQSPKNPKAPSDSSAALSDSRTSGARRASPATVWDDIPLLGLLGFRFGSILGLRACI